MTILDRFLDPVAQCLTPDVARKIVGIEFDADTQLRLDELAGKANSGRLSEAERGEHEDLIEGLDILGFVKAKARSLLRRSVT